MPYSDPLKYFTSEQKKLLADGQLTRLKKEVLLKFQLADKATILLQGEEVDKNGVLTLFEELAVNMNLHEHIAKNELLYQFLTGQNQRFLAEPSAGENTVTSLTDIKVQTLIREEIANVLDKHTTDIKNVNADSLSQIVNYTNSLSTEEQDACYSRLFLRLSNYIDKLFKDFDSPLDEIHVTRFKKDHIRHLQKSTALFLRLLPSTFESLARKYSEWCYKFFILPTAGKGMRLTDYPRASLKVIHVAALIAAEHHSKEYCKEVADAIREHLSKTGKGRWLWLLAGMLLPLILLLLVSLLNGASHSSTSGVNAESSKVHRPHTYIADDDLMPADSLTQSYDEERILREMTLGDGKTTFIRYREAKVHNGALLSSSNLKLLTKEERGEVTELYYECELLPTAFDQRHKLIPASDSKKYKGQTRTYVVHFVNKHIGKVTTSHRIRVQFPKPDRSKSKRPEVTYVPYVGSSDVPLQINGAKLSVDAYPLEGHYSTVDTKSSYAGQRHPFKVLYSDSSSTYKVTADGKEYFFHKDSIVPVLQRRLVQPDSLRFATVLHNYELLSGVVLAGSNWSIINNLFKEKDTNAYPVRRYRQGVDQIYGKVSYLFTSAEDNIAYVEVYGKDINIRYLVNYTTGETVGMHMTTIIGTYNEAERVQLFSTNR